MVLGRGPDPRPGSFQRRPPGFVIASSQPSARHSVLEGLINRCRFIAVPGDDIERLAVWCREHTPRTARFIGPPGPKTFRLWSRRSVAFNRAASPYHAAGSGRLVRPLPGPRGFPRLPGRVRASLSRRTVIDSRLVISRTSATPSVPRSPSARGQRTSSPPPRPEPRPAPTRPRPRTRSSCSMSKAVTRSIGFDPTELVQRHR